MFLNSNKNHTPHVVMGIDKGQDLFPNWKDNSIILEEISFSTIDKVNLCEYGTCTYGENIPHGKDHDQINIDISRIANRFVTIVTYLDDRVKKQFPNLVVIPKDSKFIILAIATIDDKNDEMWNSDDISQKCKLCFNNQITSTTPHFSSKGAIYSFGLHGCYETFVDGTTVANYCFKNNNALLNGTKVQCNDIISSCVTSLKNGISVINKVYNYAARVIAPVCSLLGKEIDKCHLDIVNDIKDCPMFPYLSAHLNVNVHTETFHTERDVTYTLIYFPWQKNGKELKEVVSFMFRLNHNKQFQFKVCEGFTLIYSAMLLTHRQNMLDTKHIIINFSAYGPQRLFSCLRKSFEFGDKVCIYKIGVISICVFFFNLLTLTLFSLFYRKQRGL